MVDESCIPPTRGTGSRVDATACDPIDIENIGGDVYVLIARGHHDVHEFMREVRKDYDWPLGMPQHLYFRTVPTKRTDLTCLYVPAAKGTRGAYPVTHVQEAWGAESYEAIVATESAMNVPRVRGKHEGND